MTRIRFLKRASSKGSIRVPKGFCCIGLPLGIYCIRAKMIRIGFLKRVLEKGSIRVPFGIYGIRALIIRIGFWGHYI